MGKIPDLLLEYLKSSEKILLFTHVRPDGDALGSMFGLGIILHDMGKQVVCCLEEPVPSAYEFLPEGPTPIVGLEALEKIISDKDEYLGIALDSGDLKRLGKFADLFDVLNCSYAIDHHKSHNAYADGDWVVPQASSTGELVFELAKEIDAYISTDAALNLYVAIATDTGGFRFECTGAKTHAVAGELIELGVRPEAVGVQLYDNWTEKRIRLMEMVLATLDLNSNGQVATVYVDQDMLEKTGTTLDDTDGFVDYPRSIASVKVAAFIKDTGKDMISISMRAKGECDVAMVAEEFGGGGHRNAAGFRLSKASVLDARSKVVNALESALS